MSSPGGVSPASGPPRDPEGPVEQRFLLEPPVERGIAYLPLEGITNGCGCPGCACIDTSERSEIARGLLPTDDEKRLFGRAVAIPASPPPEMEDVYSQTQWRAFKKRIEKAFTWTQCPCMPNSFLCCLCYLPIFHTCVSCRISMLEELMSDENARLGAYGLEWRERRTKHAETIGILGRMNDWVLVWQPERREQWELAQPGRRAISKEAYRPERFRTPQQKQHLRYVARQLAALEQQQLQRALEQSQQQEQPPPNPPQSHPVSSSTLSTPPPEPISSPTGRSSSARLTLPMGAVIRVQPAPTAAPPPREQMDDDTLGGLVANEGEASAQQTAD